MLEEIRLQMEGEFAGGEPDVTNAEELLREKNLMGDVDLRNLIEMRRHASNPLKSIAVKVVFVEAASHMEKVLAGMNLEAVGKLASASLGGSAKSEDQWKQLMSQELKVRVEFY